MSIEVMKQALEALERYSGVDQRACDAEDALRTAIEQAEKQEPVAWLYRDEWKTLKLSQIMPPPTGSFQVYTAPPQQEKQEPVAWQGLTREETVSLARQHLGGMPIGREFVDAVEALLREKNTAPPQRQPLAYAGVTIWVGDKTVTQLVTGVEIRHEALPGMSIEFAAKKCLSLLAAHGIGGGE